MFSAKVPGCTSEIFRQIACKSFLAFLSVVIYAKWCMKQNYGAAEEVDTWNENECYL